jgi:hypothetical protein
MEKQLAQKIFAINPSAIFKTIVTINPFKKNNEQSKKKLEKLGLLIVKNHPPIRFVESI